MLAAPALAGHAKNPRKGLVEVGFHDLGGNGLNTDVVPWKRGGRAFAASGTWGAPVGTTADGEDCPSLTDDPQAPTKSGVKIVDATPPSRPVMATRIGTVRGSQNNDIKVLRMNAGGAAEGFEGRDLLVHSLEPCGVEAVLSLVDVYELIPRPQTGFQLYDVSRPTRPVALGAHNNGGLGTHNLYPFNRPDRRRAFVAAVFNFLPLAESALFNDGDARGEVQFVDITDPNEPQLASTWGLSDAEEQGGPEFDQLCKPRGLHIDSCVLHDVWVSPNGKIAYLSFWDAGLILLDIRNPEKPRFLGQVQSGPVRDSEGNTHAAVPLKVGGKELVIVGDEDFVGGRLPGVRVNSPRGLRGVRLGTPWDGTAPVRGQRGDLVYAGTGCTPLHYAGIEVAGKIALVDKFTNAEGLPDCPAFTLQQKLTAAEAAGAIGLVQIDDDNDRSGAGAISSDIPGLELPRFAGVPIRNAVIGGDRRVNVTLERVGGADPWGFMRVIDATRPAKPRQISTFKAPHVEAPKPGPENVLSAHNPIVGPDRRVYFAWYTDGVRVLKLSRRGSEVREVAWFVPRPEDRKGDHDSDPHGAFEDNIGFWGSWPLCHPNGDLLVFNSDINRGLYILRATYDSCRRG